MVKYLRLERILRPGSIGISMMCGICLFPLSKRYALIQSLKMFDKDMRYCARNSAHDGHSTGSVGMQECWFGSSKMQRGPR